YPVIHPRLMRLLHHVLSFLYRQPRALLFLPTRRSSDLGSAFSFAWFLGWVRPRGRPGDSSGFHFGRQTRPRIMRLCEKGKPSASSEEHTSELQSRENVVCRLLLDKKKYTITINHHVQIW